MYIHVLYNECHFSLDGSSKSRSRVSQTDKLAENLGPTTKLEAPPSTGEKFIALQMRVKDESLNMRMSDNVIHHFC